MMTLAEIVKRENKKRWHIRCLACGAVYQIPQDGCIGTGHWQRDGDAVWWHWHGGYPGGWHRCEGVYDVETAEPSGL